MHKVRRVTPAAQRDPDPPGDVGISLGAATLHVYAADFLRAAKKARVSGQAFKPAQFYLACHAIELALDAYWALRNPSDTRSSRTMPRRNLAELLAETESHGLARLAALTTKQREQIRKASSYYAAMVFEYPATAEAVRGYPKTPDIDELIAAGSTLVAAMGGALRRLA